MESLAQAVTQGVARSCTGRPLPFFPHKPRQFIKFTAQPLVRRAIPFAHSNRRPVAVDPEKQAKMDEKKPGSKPGLFA
jgi:hypothetical protein